MRKLLLIAIMMAISFFSFGQNSFHNAKETEMQMVQENAKKVSQIGTFFIVLLGGSFLTFVISLVLREHKKTKQMTTETFNQLSVRKIELFNKLAGILTNIDEAKLFGIEEASHIEDLCRDLCRQRESLLIKINTAEAMEKFISDFARIEDLIMKKFVEMNEKLSILRHARAFLNQIDSATEYLAFYKKYVEDPPKILIKSPEVERLIKVTLKRYGIDLKNHIAQRESLINLCKEVNISLIDPQINLIKNTISSIAHHQELLEQIKHDDKKRADIGVNGKNFIRARINALMSYCDDEGCSQEVNDAARDGIELVSQRLVEFGADINKNYFLYRELLKVLDSCQAPYLAFKAREAKNGREEERQKSLHDIRANRIAQQEQRSSLRSNCSNTSFEAL